MSDPIYLDHNATTPLLPAVVEAMLPYLREHFGNPSSGHVYGRRAREAVEAAREQVAALIGAAPSEIVFTSGGTEANNLAIQGAAAALAHKRHVVTSVIEHPATANPCRLLEIHGSSVTWLPVDGTGRIRVEDVRGAVTDRTALVTLMHANNETGTIQPIAGIVPAIRAAGALLHTDAAQSAGKLAVRVDVLGVDLLSIAGHKLYAPKGVGALYVRSGTTLEPVLWGAGHERGLRPGTENVAAIVGLGKACEIAAASLADESRRVRSLRDDLWRALREQVPGLALNGHEVEGLPNTLNVRFPGIRGSAVLAGAPGIAASTGSACHEGGESASAVLLAMGLSADEALGSVRLSLGRGTTAEDVHRAAEMLVRSWERRS
ncbi:MAG TPA: cysteine desulfurase family protein [Polyangia bacterium]|nr:cysteine desulfurase family protein [Polyangia bacterium]